MRWNVSHSLSSQYLFNSFVLFFRHLQRAGHIKSFAVVSEEAISKGIRRIVALTGSEAVKVGVA